MIYIEFGHSTNFSAERGDYTKTHFIGPNMHSKGPFHHLYFKSYLRMKIMLIILVYFSKLQIELFCTRLMIQKIRKAMMRLKKILLMLKMLKWKMKMIKCFLYESLANISLGKQIAVAERNFVKMPGEIQVKTW